MANGEQPGEPTLAQVRHQYPHWACTRAISGLYHAHHPATGSHATGEDPLDLRDQIKAAEARYNLHHPGQPSWPAGPPVL